MKNSIVTIILFALFLEFSLYAKPNIELIYIPISSFIMGSRKSEYDDEKPERKIELNSFYISKYETTYEDWLYVYNYAIKNGYTFDNVGQNGSTIFWEEMEDLNNYPVVNINWYDAVKWCNALSEMLSLTPVYYTDKNKKEVYKKDKIDITSTMVDWQANGYRLPTEAEWEYSASSGLKRNYAFSDNLEDIYLYANIADLSAKKIMQNWKTIEIDDGFSSTSSVGSFLSNNFGLYDTVGNVWEWCFDMYGVYRKDVFKNPKGATISRFRVFRGSSFENYGIDNLRAEKRMGEYPYFSDVFLGFRVAKSKN